MGRIEIIEKYSEIKIENLDQEYFLKSFLDKCYEKKLLEDKDFNKIYFERLNLLKIQLKYYTKDESSSVMVEVAEKILNGVDYTIGVYLKSLENVDLIIEELKVYSLDEIFKKGNDLIKEKVVKSKKLLGKIQENKLKVNNFSYSDTIDYGISLFFKQYNDFFLPQETPASIDYQLCLDNMNYVGIEYIENYLHAVNLENKFSYYFSINEIKELLKGYDEKSELLLINIFELVLTNAIGLMICGQPLSSLNINNVDRNYIKEQLKELSQEKLEEELLMYASNLCEDLNIINSKLINYIYKAVFKIAPSIKGSIELNKLETVFIEFSKEDYKVIEYVDKKRMSNSKFKRVTEKIRETSSMKEKIKIIKESIESLEDLIDMLNSDCLFDNEFEEYFITLSQTEIVLLYKHISDFSLDNSYNKEWYQCFNKYVLSLSEEEKITIRQLGEKITLR